MTSQLEAPQEIESPEPAHTSAFEHLLEVPVRVEALLGTLRMQLRAISALQVGTILRTQKPAGEPLELRVNSAVIAAAEVYPNGENLSLRVVEMYLDQ